MTTPRAWGPKPGKPFGAFGQGPGVTPKAPPPPKPPKARPPKTPGVKPVAPIDPDQAATNNAMSAFRTALEQLQSSTPAVDSNAIYAPYRASEAVTGQLGTGLQTAVQGAGQAAQNQYAAGRDLAQSRAAQFGIAAGAGAAPTALTDTGTGAIAQQTQAYATAAPQAATAWQQLLERSGAAKVSDANLARQQSLTAGQQALATNIPSAIANEKQLGFQKKTEKDNMALAYTQLDQKGQSELRDYLLSSGKAASSAAAAAEAARIKREQLAEKKGNDAAKLRLQKDALALKQRTASASASGLKGVAAAAKALSGSYSSASTRKVAKGWDVQVRPWDDELGEFSGPAQTMHVPDKRHAPAGYKLVSGASAATHYETVPSAGGSAGVTRSVWDAQMRSLLAQNPGRAKEVRAFMGPRPKK